MTFAELVIKFETQGNDKVLRDVRSIEVSIRNVATSSNVASNKIVSNFKRIQQSSKVFENLQTAGKNISQQFITASASSIPFADNLLDIVQTLSIMGNKVNVVQKFFEAFLFLQKPFGLILKSLVYASESSILT